MPTDAQEQTAGNTMLVDSPAEASKEKDAVFRSPQDFSLALEDAIKIIKSKGEETLGALRTKFDDFEQKLQVLELAIEEANVVFGEPYKAPDSEQLTDSEDTLAGSVIQ